MSIRNFAIATTAAFLVCAVTLEGVRDLDETYSVLPDHLAELVRGGCTKSGTNGCGNSGQSCVQQNGGQAGCQPNGQDENGFVIFTCGNGLLTQVTANGDYALASSGFLCGLTTIIPSGSTHYCATLKTCGCKAFPPGGPLACSPSNPEDGDPRQPTVPAGDICPPEGCGGIASIEMKPYAAVLLAAGNH